MLNSITQLIEAILGDLSNWDTGTKPWFRGESDEPHKEPLPPLRPRIADYPTPQLRSFNVSCMWRLAPAVSYPVRA